MAHHKQMVCPCAEANDRKAGVRIDGARVTRARHSLEAQNGVLVWPAAARRSLANFACRAFSRGGRFPADVNRRFDTLRPHHRVAHTTIRSYPSHRCGWQPNPIVCNPIRTRTPTRDPHAPAPQFRPSHWMPSTLVLRAGRVLLPRGGDSTSRREHPKCGAQERRGGVNSIAHWAAMPASQKSPEREEPVEDAEENRPLSGNQEDREQHGDHEADVPQAHARGEGAVLGRLESRAVPHRQRGQRISISAAAAET
eukprot:scaffold22445_cov73-Phaeocystis_antarctica.AAC.3